MGKTSFLTRDEQQVAGYAEVMEMVFENYTDIPVTENYIKQLHSVLLRHSKAQDWVQLHLLCLSGKHCGKKQGRLLPVLAKNPENTS